VVGEIFGPKRGEVKKTGKIYMIRDFIIFSCDGVTDCKWGLDW
jgi:hypothetical protein